MYSKLKAFVETKKMVYRMINLTSVGLIFLLAVNTVYSSKSPLTPVKLDSPRDTMRSYMSAMSDYKRGMETGNRELKNRINDASRCFNLEDFPLVLRDEKGREVAILLKEVIDRVIIVDYQKIPDVNDDPQSPLLRWRLKDTEITILFQESGEHAGEYLFSKDTTYRAREFYNKVKHLPYLSGSGEGALYNDPWIEAALPSWAKKQWLFYPNWQWIGLFLAILVGLIIKITIQSFVHLLKYITTKTRAQWDDKIIIAIKRPIGMIGASAFWFFSIHLLQFEGTALTILTITVQIIFSISLIWLCYRLVNVFTEYLDRLTAKTDSSFDDQLVPLLQKALKIFVVVFGILVMFQNLGINVISVLAGLGLGGLAFALAARDMCANLFGSIMIFLDRPFNIGDWIIVNNTEGTVEEIGFRSTRIRTFYNSQVTIPNSILANANIDNMGKRRYRRIKAFFGLTYDTPPEKMEAFLEGVRNIIEANPYTRKDYYHIVFNEYGDFSLQVMLYCFLKVPDWATELVERQNIYLEVLRLAKKLEVDFAFPTQSVHVDSFPGAESIARHTNFDEAGLGQSAKAFGPNGNDSCPGGLGIFTPPYRAARKSTG